MSFTFAFDAAVVVLVIVTVFFGASIVIVAVTVVVILDFFIIFLVVVVGVVAAAAVAVVGAGVVFRDEVNACRPRCLFVTFAGGLAGTTAHLPFVGLGAAG